MKKILSGLATSALALGMLGTSALANQAITHEVQTAVSSSQEFTVISNGQASEDLSAVTAKYGSSVVDNWVVTDEDGNTVDSAIVTNKDSDTVLQDVNGVNSYVATTHFTATEPGTYKVTYNIDMKAGKSEVTFSGTDSENVTVKAVKQITGIEFHLISKGTVGNNEQYKGEIYLVYSDGTTEDTGKTANVTFSKNGNDTLKEVQFTVDGKTYTTQVAR
jgi:hypothetical protein